MSKLQHLIDIMQVKADGDRRFIADPGHGGFRIYGGLIVAQAMDAARQCCPDNFAIQSLHGQFMRPGDYEHKIEIEVQDLKDGRQFKIYNVYCRQQGKVIFFATVTFHLPRESFEHTLPLPCLKLPSEYKAMFYHQRDEMFTFEQLGGATTAFEVRMEDKNNFHSAQSPETTGWYKTADSLAMTHWQHTLMLAYLSDWNMPSVAMRPHGVKEGYQPVLASLDHALWFYGQANVHDWMVYVQDTPAALNSRGHTRGLLYSQGGALLACVSQESFLSSRERPKDQGLAR